MPTQPKRFFVYHTDEYKYGEMPKVWKVAKQTITDGIASDDKVYDEVFDSRDEAIQFALPLAGGISVANDELDHEKVEAEGLEE